MPCFLAGAVPGDGAWPGALGVPFSACSHQQGHLAAAAWSAGRMDLLDRSLPGLAPVRRHHRAAAGPAPGRTTVPAEKLGGTSGYLRRAAHRPHRRPAGAPVPSWQSAGRALSSGRDSLYGVPREAAKDLTFSLSGMENQVKQYCWRSRRRPRPTWPASPCDTVVQRGPPGHARRRQRRCPGLPVLCSGGVASNPTAAGRHGEASCGSPVRRSPDYSTDNAMGVAIADPTGPGGRGAGMREETIPAVPPRSSGYIKQLDGPATGSSPDLLRAAGSCPTIRCIPPAHHYFTLKDSRGGTAVPSCSGADAGLPALPPGERDAGHRRRADHRVYPRDGAVSAVLQSA